MKVLLIIFTLIFMTTAVGFKQQQVFDDNIITGKLVIKGPCGQRVVSIISPITRGSKVQENWRDPVTGELYKNVFSVRNFCELSSLEEGESFSFRFIKMKMDVCTNCLLYRPVPGAEAPIKIVSKDSTNLFRYIDKQNK